MDKLLQVETGFIHRIFKQIFIILIPIGKYSNGETKSISLKDSGNIFLSYFNDEQCYIYIHKSIDALSNKKAEFYLAVKYILNNQLNTNNTFHTYFTDKPWRSDSTNKADFIKTLNKKFNQLKGKNKKEASAILCIIDNVWEFMTNQNITTQRTFMKMISEGPELGMHFILTSPLPFQNLFIQLQKTSSSKPLGTEIVLTADELVFIKNAETMEFVRYFKL